MVSTEHDFLFVHIPKTAGNAIQNVLREYSEARVEADADHLDGEHRFGVTDEKYGTTKHSPISEYQAAIEPEVYERLFKFAVIRNPWDRMISAYFSPHRGDVEWRPEAFREFVQDQPPLRYYIDTLDFKGRLAGKIARVSPGGAQLVKPLGEDLDFVFRFENLNEGFQRLCDHIGIPKQSLPVRNESNRDHYSAYYTAELRGLVGRRFAEEIRFGDYHFEALQGT